VGEASKATPCSAAQLGWWRQGNCVPLKDGLGKRIENANLSEAKHHEEETTLMAVRRLHP
jgi:hypothetical protein